MNIRKCRAESCKAVTAFINISVENGRKINELSWQSV